jgi:hypothetical protein
MAKAKNTTTTPKAEAPKVETPKPETAKDNSKGATPKAVEKLMSYAELAALKVGELATYLKKIVTQDAAMTKAKETFVKSLQFHAKVVAALKRAYVEKLNGREIPPDTTFKKYFEQNAGGTLPGRVEALAALFNSLCLTIDANGKPLLSEECFDNAAVDWLEKANAIIKQAQKQHGDAWKTCDEVLDTINALSKPGDALKAIKEIRARQKGEKPEGEETEGDASAMQPLTVGRCVEFLKAAIKNGGNMLAAGKKDEVFDLFSATFGLHETWLDSSIDSEMLNGWTAQILGNAEIGVAPHIEVTPGVTAPAEAAAALAN